MPGLKIPVIRHITARPRLAVSVLIGVIVFALFAPTQNWPTRLLVSWNAMILPYLVMAGIMMAGASDATMRKRAAAEDDGRITVLVLVIVATIASFVAIFAELVILREATPADRAWRLGLSVATILTSWSFIHVVFTQHYAHEFYVERHRDEAGHLVQSGGLVFPGEKSPDYIDFLYFAFTIGVANQTADVSVASRMMRFYTLVHSVLSYLFNTTILALTINIATSQM